MSRFRKRSHAIWPCQYPLGEEHRKARERKRLEVGDLMTAPATVEAGSGDLGVDELAGHG